jgi:hypothetical protein
MTFLTIATVHLGEAHADVFSLSPSGSFKFLSPDDRAVRIGELDLIERKKGGMYAAPVYNISNITCDISSSSNGNSGTANTDGNSGAPSALNNPMVTSDAIGNSAGGETSDALNSAGNYGTSTVNTSQTVDGSSQSSTIGQTEIGGISGSVAGSNSTLSQNALNEQTLTETVITSNLSEVTACTWNDQ